ncbi:hypothetical protein KXW98_002076 [Aspergillus fumigatus]|nr:hypothetical protein CNMCM8057_000650 [Aspergillus fumigatus]KAF4282903.1 hypothetical protein CNMCM8689_007760 [Aspergillus fumigatus]KAF4291766.1 hypothetical protein CNMCM8686_008329 [Aspergillus fumigatus]KAH1270246.1 hypothetical protein KXX45_001979 [Aspergillus fumigatus]KAH1282517.1 hypothetical protein KXX30_002374 [Aspergillus fumigatus]
MDNNSCHTMEILRIMGFVDEYRQQLGAVPQHSDWDTIFFNTCGAEKKLVARWHIPSNNEYRAKIHANNDGSQPAEPGQRCSQIVLEAFLKKKCLAEPLIASHFGYKFVSLEEDGEGVSATFTDMGHQEKKIRAPYLVGADGARSKVRKSVGIELQGRPLPGAFFMVHFRSKELTKLSPFGKWWHAFGIHGGFMIDQDDVDTYTCHEPCSANAAAIRDLQEHPEDVPYRVLGSLGKPYKFQIDEIMLANAWRPNFALADSYVSRDGQGRVFLGGDAAHQNPPHGGYGMNSGVEDAISLAWRLSALYKGIGGGNLITSYTNERRPNMMLRLERCAAHIGKFTPMIMRTMMAPSTEIFLEESEEGEKARAEIATHLDSVGPENIDRGVELDLRYLNSEIIVSDGTREPRFDNMRYTPSTRPGHRAPHVFLRDDQTSIVDLYGTEWSLMDFSKVKSDSQTTNGFVSLDGEMTSPVATFKAVAKAMQMPLTHVQLDAGEKHVKEVWENYDYVLVRPDGYVAWRGGKEGARDECCELNEGRIRNILRIALGWKTDPGFVVGEKKELNLKINLTSIHGVEEELGLGKGHGDAFVGIFREDKRK